MMLGYVEFIGLLFIPGMAFMDLFGLGRSLSLIERFSLAWGLSISILAVTLFVRTSGGDLLGVKLQGFGTLTPILILGASAVVLLGAVGFRRASVFLSKPSRWDLAVVAIVVVQVCLLIVHFLKYPIFPSSSSVDFRQTAILSDDIQRGLATSFPSGLLYQGVDTLIGSLLVLTSSSTLLASQQTLAIIASFTPLLVYAFALSLTASRRVAIYSALLYVLTGILWYGMLFDSGIYANFYGLLSAMLLVVLLGIVRAEPRRPQVWLAYVIVVANAYISHYSILTVFPAILAVFASRAILSRRVDKAEGAALLGLVAPGAIALALVPSLTASLLPLLQPGANVNVLFSTTLSTYLASFPFLSFLVTEVANDVLSVVLMALAVVGVYYLVRKGNATALLLVFWFASLLVAAPLGGTAWRYSFVAILPLTILAALGLERLQSPDKPRRPKKRPKNLSGKGFDYGILVVVVLLLVMFGTSETYTALADSLNGTSGSSQAQYYVLQSMQWVANNSQPTFGVVSPSDQNFLYAALAVDRPGDVIPAASPQDIVPRAPSLHLEYVALTQYVTVPGGAPAFQRLYQLYADDPSLKLVYQNPDVTIYKVIGVGGP